MEDVEGPAAVNGELPPDPLVEDVEAAIQRGKDPAPVVLCVRGIGPAEGLGDVRGHRLQQRRRKPDVLIQPSECPSATCPSWLLFSQRGPASGSFSMPFGDIDDYESIVALPQSSLRSLLRWHVDFEENHRPAHSPTCCGPGSMYGDLVPAELHIDLHMLSTDLLDEISQRRYARKHRQTSVCADHSPPPAHSQPRKALRSILRQTLRCAAVFAEAVTGSSARLGTASVKQSHWIGPRI